MTCFSTIDPWLQSFQRVDILSYFCFASENARCFCSEGDPWPPCSVETVHGALTAAVLLWWGLGSKSLNSRNPSSHHLPTTPPCPSHPTSLPKLVSLWAPALYFIWHFLQIKLLHHRMCAKPSPPGPYQRGSRKLVTTSLSSLFPNPLPGVCLMLAGPYPMAPSCEQGTEQSLGMCADSEIPLLNFSVIQSEWQPLKGAYGKCPSKDGFGGLLWWSSG